MNTLYIWMLTIYLFFFLRRIWGYVLKCIQNKCKTVFDIQLCVFFRVHECKENLSRQHVLLLEMVLLSLFIPQRVMSVACVYVFMNTLKSFFAPILSFLFSSVNTCVCMSVCECFCVCVDKNNNLRILTVIYFLYLPWKYSQLFYECANRKCKHTSREKAIVYHISISLSLSHSLTHSLCL